MSDHPEYRNWNPSKGRINCFKEVLPLVEDLLGGSSTGDKKSPSSSSGRYKTRFSFTRYLNSVKEMNFDKGTINNKHNYNFVFN